ncbi:MAG TPA: carboxylating.nicotinate-nucleotide diphosphorylase, partial [Candidatus Altiarchaeales archaeon]|nr:carboxylating.nicotinate-nucleotide diphosphorylase [Candidatus Altiarchaeales archaeon]
KLEELGLREKVILEASGNISLDTVKEFASSGVDVLSIGMLTHSYKSIDFSLEIRR